MDTARHTAHLVFQIENILTKIRQDNSFLSSNSPQLNVMMNSYEAGFYFITYLQYKVRDSTLSLIKITKEMKGQPQPSFEEAIGNTCKLLGASIKTMLISAEVVIKVVTF